MILNSDSKIWLAYVSYPVTTAAYFENALRSKYNVVTVGPKLPDELIEGWNLENLKVPIRDLDLNFGFQPDYEQLINSIPANLRPDYYLWVESVAGYSPKNISALGCPTACYLIDSHMNLDYHLEIAKNFDFVFIAQLEYLDVFKLRVHDNVFWLPLGADPLVHSKTTINKLYEIGFVGSVSSQSHQRRANLLNNLSSHFPVAYKRCFDKEMSQHFSESKIVFNNAIKNDLNMRVFETMSIGTMLLTDLTTGSGQEEMFVDGEDYVIYDDENIIEKADYYLKNENERERIAANGQKLIANAHYYNHRVDELFKVFSGEKKQTNSPEQWRELSAGNKTQVAVKSEMTSKKLPHRSFVIPVLDMSPASEYNITTLLNNLQEIEGEVIVVFNSVDMYEQLKDHPRIDEYAVLKHNVGVSRAWNVGLDIARAPITFILNADLYIEEDAVLDLEKAFDYFPDAAIVGPQGTYLNFNKLSILEYFDKGSFLEPMQVDDVSGFLFAVKTELYNSGVIHFDSQFTPCYTEEWDIALQCKASGLKTYIIPTTAYKHIWGGSIGSLDREISFYDQSEKANNILVRNRKAFLSKWQSIAQISDNDDLLTSYWVLNKFTTAFDELEKGNKHQCTQIFNDILNEFPNHIQSLETIGKTYLSIGENEAALNIFSKIVELKPDYQIDLTDDSEEENVSNQINKQ